MLFQSFCSYYSLHNLFPILPSLQTGGVKSQVESFWHVNILPPNNVQPKVQLYVTLVPLLRAQLSIVPCWGGLSIGQSKKWKVVRKTSTCILLCRYYVSKNIFIYLDYLGNTQKVLYKLYNTFSLCTFPANHLRHRKIKQNTYEPGIIKTASDKSLAVMILLWTQHIYHCPCYNAHKAQANIYLRISENFEDIFLCEESHEQKCSLNKAFNETAKKQKLCGS